MKTIIVGDKQVERVTVGDEAVMTLMAGPCVIESREICRRIAGTVKELAEKLGVGYIFKASFDKANRTSGKSFRGPGLEEGLKILDEVRREFAVPVITDIHLPDQARPVAEVVDMVQIPAFLCRQTDLLVAAAETGKCVQVKKAQFMAPGDMKNVIGKIAETGNENVTLVERGSSFGYNRLVCDMTAIAGMQELGYPVILDATHSTQQPGGLGAASGGSPAMAHVLARAGIAAGADGLFIETHPSPKDALSDAACMLGLDELEPLLTTCRDIYLRVRQ